MRYGSVCSGIEAASVAWIPIGWEAAWFSEIEPFPCRLLKHYYPQVPNLGDMMRLADNPLFNESVIDLLVGGTPCQSFSLAGLRDGLASANGNLALQFCRVLRAKRPRWFVWENVPGALSSFSDDAAGADLPGEGREHGRTATETADFATILRGFSECGYSVCWRVLNSKFFGVPQSRRRVFVVGHLGDDWRPPAAVLLEPHCLRGGAAPGGEAGEEVAGAVIASAGRSRGAGTPAGMINEAPTLTQMNEVPILFGGWPAETATTLNAAFGDKQGLEDQHINSGATYFVPHLKGGKTVVRRLTPRECERLQGFPDDYTLIPKAADTARYKALGNSMPVPVMHWIGRRIDLVDRLIYPHFYPTPLP